MFSPNEVNEVFRDIQPQVALSLVRDVMLVVVVASLPKPHGIEKLRVFLIVENCIPSFLL